MTGVMSKEPRSHSEEAPLYSNFKYSEKKKKKTTVNWNTKNKFLKFTMIP